MTCPTCKTDFKPYRTWQRFCTPKCRWAAWAAENDRQKADPSDRWSRELWTHYRIRRADWDRLLLACQGRCQICADAPRRLHVDHDHTSGRVRGLLCPRCNHLVGALEANRTLLAATEAYLL
jgi:hypothetical protein